VYFLSGFEHWRFLQWQKIYVGNAPVVFAGNGFSPLHSRKDGKGHAVRHAGKNFIEDNVNNGTGKTKHISRATIWLIRSERSMNRNNPGIHRRHD